MNDLWYEVNRLHILAYGVPMDDTKELKEIVDVLYDINVILKDSERKLQDIAKIIGGTL